MEIIWLVLFLLLIVVGVCICFDTSNLAGTDLDPDRDPFQDIPGQQLVPGEQLFA